MSDTTQPTLFHKLGGGPTVRAVVDAFYERVLGDPELAPFFHGTDMVRQKAHQAAFVGMALGGPKGDYQGRSMRDAHAALDLEDRHFDGVAGHLQATLEGAGVGTEDVSTILGAIAPLRSEVLGR